MKPTLKHSPDLVILHIGTNELRSKKDALQIAEEIIDLADHVKTTNNDVILSSLVVRSDLLNTKGMAVNRILKLKCAQRQYGYCDNDNIEIKDLNKSGLHLTNMGSWQLATNFIDFIEL